MKRCISRRGIIKEVLYGTVASAHGVGIVSFRFEQYIILRMYSIQIWLTLSPLITVQKLGCLAFYVCFNLPSTRIKTDSEG